MVATVRVDVNQHSDISFTNVSAHKCLSTLIRVPIKKVMNFLIFLLLLSTISSVSALYLDVSNGSAQSVVSGSLKF